MATDLINKREITRKWRLENKEHIRKYQQLYYKTNIEHINEYNKTPARQETYKKFQRSNKAIIGQRRVLLKQYNLTLEDYVTMISSQDNKCYICKSSEISKHRKTGKSWSLCVDHDHSTGQVRKLLCRRCNSVLGWIQEDISILTSMIHYLKEFE